jgi:mannose-1-phosphate guanylyltransferase
MIVPMLLAGGCGSRLWPLSRRLHPKQFLSLTRPDATMLQETMGRLDGLPCEHPIVVCSEEHRFLAAEQLRQLGEEESLILEPAPRDTAPAVTLGVLRALSFDDDPLLLVLPADHAIDDVEAFQRSVAEGQKEADEGALVAFGVPPTHPETGYGYIRRGAPAAAAGFAIERFLEKPDAETAAAYLRDGGYLWNSGMFMFRASRFLEELERFQPRIVAACRRAWQGAQHDMDFIRVDREAFLASPGDSVDCAVMENTERGVVVPLEAGWRDVGSWRSLSEAIGPDADGNVLQGDVLATETAGSFVRSESRLVAVCGVSDLIVVETKDAVLVVDRARAQDVKGLVEELEALGRTEHVSHREVYRPWGVYDSVDHGERYRVKRITVKPGAGLSLQKHHHRAEHWVVVRGTAQVRRGDETYLVAENESTYIPVGEVHSLENPGVIPLEMVEVQSGSYLEEDDIVRLEDRYGRG